VLSGEKDQRTGVNQDERLVGFHEGITRARTPNASVSPAGSAWHSRLIDVERRAMPGEGLE
jgi:hypothetical protein